MGGRSPSQNSILGEKGRTVSIAVLDGNDVSADAAVIGTLRPVAGAVIPDLMLTPPHAMTDIVRRYKPADRRGCLDIFDSNVPEFFDSAERSSFVSFLDDQAVAWLYQVIERQGRTVACGGFAVASNGLSAGLCWGMVARGLHGTGLGSLLTNARLEAARAISGIEQVRLDTSQHTQGFYRRFGFVVEQIVPDGYGPGLDRWDMLLGL